MNNLHMGKHAPRKTARMGVNKLNAEGAHVRRRSFNRVVDETPMVSIVWAVGAPVGIGGNVDVFLAFNHIADHQIRIFFGRHFVKSFGCQFACDGPMDLVVELVWVQLHPDELLDTANKAKRLEPGEIQIGIEIGSDFG